MPDHVLVGDIGGTNVRFASARIGSSGRPEIENVKILPGDNYSSFGEALKHYLEHLNVDHPTQALFAFAGPVKDGVVTLTHRKNWHVNNRTLAKELGFDRIRLVNDYAAMARSIPELPEDCFRVLHEGSAPSHRAPILVGGPGTGLGMATLIPIGSQDWSVLTGEGGHTAFAPRTAREWAVTQQLLETHGYVSKELVLAGKGLDDVHRALCEIDGQPYTQLEPAEIMRRAELNDPICRDICDIRTSATMDALGNAALTNGARGGVVITGGVAERLADWFDRPQVLKRFFERGPMSHYMEPIPVRLLQSGEAALIGAAALHFDREQTQ